MIGPVLKITIIIIIIKAVEVAQKLRKVAALAKAPGSVPITYMVAHNYL